MITKAQAIAAGAAFSNCRHMHYTGKHECSRHVGPRGGVTVKVTEVRANGACKTWKTRPNEFRLPIKYGMYEYWYIDQDNAADFHMADECPLLDAVQLPESICDDGSIAI